MDEHSDKHEAEKPPRYSFSLLSKGGVLNHILHLASSNCVPSRAYFPKRVMDCLPGDRLYVMYLLVYVQLLQSCPTLCGPMGLPVSSVRGILQARILEWVVCPPPGDLPPQELNQWLSGLLALAGGFFTKSTTWKAHAVYLLIHKLPYLVLSTSLKGSFSCLGVINEDTNCLENK